MLRKVAIFPAFEIAREPHSAPIFPSKLIGSDRDPMHLQLAENNQSRHALTYTLKDFPAHQNRAFAPQNRARFSAPRTEGFHGFWECRLHCIRRGSRQRNPASGDLESCLPIII